MKNETKNEIKRSTLNRYLAFVLAVIMVISMVPMVAFAETSYSITGGTATVKFNLKGGTLDGQTGTITKTYMLNETINLLQAPTRVGYEFLYWNNVENYPAGASYTVTGNTTFTAKWESYIDRVEIEWIVVNGEKKKVWVNSQGIPEGYSLELEFYKDDHTVYGEPIPLSVNAEHTVDNTGNLKICSIYICGPGGNRL
ncbi:MAG: InlB B-repeat-containing protein [Clostridiales bacterium]|nr:InlB B-repeat-containing protein [Clostridiales bacterium]